MTNTKDAKGTLIQYWRDPAALLLAVADDVEAIDRNSYRWDMSAWHTPTVNGDCAICLSGALIAGRLGAEPTEVVFPSSYDFETRQLLNAVDYFRKTYTLRVGLGRCGLTHYEIELLMEDSKLQSPRRPLVPIDPNRGICWGDPDPRAIRDLAYRIEAAMEAEGVSP